MKTSTRPKELWFMYLKSAVKTFAEKHRQHKIMQSALFSRLHKPLTDECIERWLDIWTEEALKGIRAKG